MPVPDGNKEAYRQIAAKAAPVYREYGATRFGRMASKAVRDEANPKLMADPRVQPDDDMPFDGKRVIFGGFEALLEA